MGHRAPPPRREPCESPGCRHVGTWRVFTPDDRHHACAVHLAYVIITTGSTHAAVEQIPAPAPTALVVI